MGFSGGGGGLSCRYVVLRTFIHSLSRWQRATPRWGSLDDWLQPVKMGINMLWENRKDRGER